MTKARTLADNFAADINGITAGTGITGGGTSGTVTITNDMATSINAKGDLVVGTANDTYSRLAVASTAGYVLTVDSAEATGLKWGAPPGGGKVLQVVSGTTTSNVSTTNTSGTDSGLSASITPSSTSSKILVLSSQLIQISRVSSNGKTGVVKLNRGTTTLTTWNTDAVDLAGINVAANSSQQIDLCTWVSFSYLDSPNTTSSTTYKTQILNTVSSGTATIQAQKENFMGSIVLLEIGA
jgi:hypothetical protein